MAYIVITLAVCAFVRVHLMAVTRNLSLYSRLAFEFSPLFSHTPFSSPVILAPPSVAPDDFSSFPLLPYMDTATLPCPRVCCCPSLFSLSLSFLSLFPPHFFPQRTHTHTTPLHLLHPILPHNPHPTPNSLPSSTSPFLRLQSHHPSSNLSLPPLPTPLPPHSRLILRPPPPPPLQATPFLHNATPSLQTSPPAPTSSPPPPQATLPPTSPLPPTNAPLPTFSPSPLHLPPSTSHPSTSPPPQAYPSPSTTPPPPPSTGAPRPPSSSLPPPRHQLPRVGVGRQEEAASSLALVHALHGRDRVRGGLYGRERMDEAKMELMRTVRRAENHHVPILVLANKQDLPGAKDAAQVEKVLGLKDLGPAQLYHVQPSCAIIGDGLEDGLESLYDMICKKKKINKNNHKNSKKR
ncbi:hypothetical protein C7M84_022388 [Penaeus vannamei]|uniref:Uncharacterized protein n=1 Tax=Penaeus vannamei TaxID=6689 RepID=A0A3R7NDR0_PENVA|nr:hypothetical protein C7M84_022388 [Penaeus vannamei]